MKKKLLSIIVATAMVASLLVGCGSKAADTAAPAADAATEDAAVEEAAPAADGNVQVGIVLLLSIIIGI